MAGPRSVIINLIANERISDAVKSAGRSLDQLNDKINDTLKNGAKQGAMAGGVAAGGAFVAGLTGMIQLDNTRAKIEAQLGLTKQESGRIGGVAGKLFAAAYGESMEDVNAAVVSVVQNMDGMKDASSSALQTMTARAMDVATVMDDDVGNVTKAVSQMMKTGLAKNAQEAFDIITRGAQTGGNKAQDLLDTFNEYGTQFRKLGLTGQSAMGLIQQGLKGGARDADVVADAFKEFSIRAIDGSDTTVAGFKSLGLNADKTAKMIAAGGPTAAKGLDLVMDRLRAVKDPIDQAAIATSLFGTQSEDLGKALFAMDPSSAVQALGKVEGAADKAGAALGGTAQAKFESFKRTLQQDVMAALANTVAWFSKHQTVLKVLIGVIIAAVVVWGTYNTIATIVAIKTALMTSGTVANTIATKIAAAATKTWAAAQWLWNAAMSANPIGIVIIAIVALVAAIVIAYKNSATFRAIVQAAWAGIKAAAVSAWAIIKGVFGALWGWINSNLIPGFKLLWSMVKLVWAGVMLAIKAAWAVIGPVFRAIVAIVKGVLIVAFVLLKNSIKVVWIAIQIAIKVAWLIIKGYFAAIKYVITNVLAPAFKWLYSNIIKPIWNAIKGAIQTNWLAIKIIFSVIKSYLSSILGPAFRTFKTATSAAWTGLRSSISTVWNSGIKPIFNGIKTAVGAVREAFRRAIDGIRVIWGNLKNIARVPVNFVIGMYNRGIVGLVNGIARVAGVGTRLSTLPTFARGGVMPGYAPGRDSLIAAVSPGESIFRPEFTKAVGSSWVHNANAIARTQGAPGVRKWMSGGKRLGGEGINYARGGTVPGFAGHFDIGGIVGGFVKKAKDFTLGNISRAANGILGKILNVSVPGQGLIKDLIAGIPRWIKDKLFGWLKDKSGGAGGPGMQRALAFAKAQAGKPYVWGGVGPGGYDCSGFMSAIHNVIQGRNPYARMYSTHAFGATGGPGGFQRNLRSGFMVGVTHAGVGHMAGTLLGNSVESSGSAGVRVGGGARGAYNGLFGAQYGLKADTGRLTLKRGWNPPVFNGTGKPEMLSTAAAGGGDVHIHNHGVIGSQAELERWLAMSMERLRRQNKLPGVS